MVADAHIPSMNSGMNDNNGDNEDPALPWELRAANAVRAYFEYMPIRPASQSSRSLLGKEQRKWVRDNLLKAKADRVTWAAAERERILDTIEQHAIDNVVVLTGDVHSSFAMDVPREQFKAYEPDTGVGYDPATGRGSLAVEMVCNNVTSLSANGPCNAVGFDNLFRTQNRNVKYVSGQLAHWRSPTVAYKPTSTSIKSPARTQKYKQLCHSLGLKGQLIGRAAPARWLSLRKPAERLVRDIRSLVSYFDTASTCISSLLTDLPTLLAAYGLLPILRSLNRLNRLCQSRAIFVEDLMQEVALTANKITAMYSGPSPFSALDFPELTAFTNLWPFGIAAVGSGSMTVQLDEADSDSEEPVQLYAIPPKGRRAALVPASDFQQHVDSASAAANPAKETTKLWRYLAGQPITKADILEYIKLAELDLPDLRHTQIKATVRIWARPTVAAGAAAGELGNLSDGTQRGVNFAARIETHCKLGAPVKAMVKKKRGVKARWAGLQKAREVMAQVRAADAEAKAQAGAAEAEDQAQAEAQLHQPAAQGAAACSQPALAKTTATAGCLVLTGPLGFADANEEAGLSWAAVRADGFSNSWAGGCGVGFTSLLLACRTVLRRPGRRKQEPSRLPGLVVLVDEHRTSQVSSFVNMPQLCEKQSEDSRSDL
ncbi:hypothetical protein QJQ45_015433 [Haematococcus lacustris]|nr:hypothetical protein QJQ45_015433 [Haematococcus lacustris]